MLFSAERTVTVVGVLKQGKNRMFAVNERGLPIGEDHPRAVLSDHDVALMLELRDQGFSLSWLAGKFEISKSQAGRICRGSQRAQPVARWRRA